MDVEWLIIAQSYSVGSGVSNIGGIFTHIAVKGPPYLVAPILVIAKLDIDPTETGGTQTVRFHIRHDDGESIGDYVGEYHIPDLKTWALRSETITWDIPGIGFPKTGEYVFEIYVNDALKNQKRVTVIDWEDYDADVES